MGDEKRECLPKAKPAKPPRKYHKQNEDKGLAIYNPNYEHFDMTIAQSGRHGQTVSNHPADIAAVYMCDDGRTPLTRGTIEGVDQKDKRNIQINSRNVRRTGSQDDTNMKIYSEKEDIDTEYQKTLQMTIDNPPLTYPDTHAQLDMSMPLSLTKGDNHPGIRKRSEKEEDVKYLEKDMFNNKQETLATHLVHEQKEIDVALTSSTSEQLEVNQGHTNIRVLQLRQHVYENTNLKTQDFDPSGLLLTSQDLVAGLSDSINEHIAYIDMRGGLGSPTTSRSSRNRSGYTSVSVNSYSVESIPEYLMADGDIGINDSNEQNQDTFKQYLPNIHSEAVDMGHVTEHNSQILQKYDSEKDQSLKRRNTIIVEKENRTTGNRSKLEEESHKHTERSMTEKVHATCIQNTQSRIYLVNAICFIAGVGLTYLTLHILDSNGKLCLFSLELNIREQLFIKGEYWRN